MTESEDKLNKLKCGASCLEMTGEDREWAEGEKEQMLEDLRAQVLAEAGE